MFTGCSHNGDPVQVSGQNDDQVHAKTCAKMREIQKL